MLVDSVYRIFLARAAAELERIQALARLREAPAGAVLTSAFGATRARPTALGVRSNCTLAETV